MSDSLIFTGNLFSTERTRAAVDYGASFEPYAKTTPRPGWRRLEYRTSQPLLEGQLADRGPYTYPFLLRSSGPRFLLLGPESTLPEHFLVKVGLWRNVLRPSIRVPELVQAVTAHPGPYSLSAVFARTDAYGHSLRTVMLYGSDLANAKLFRNILGELSPFRATLRDVRTRHEVITVGSRGEIAFHYSGPNTLAKVDEALTYISEGKHMRWGANADK